MLTADNKTAPEVFSPEELSPEIVMASSLMYRISQLPKESLEDLALLAPEIARCQSPEEAREIAETMREIIFPELIGNLTDTASIGVPNKLQKHIAWIAQKIKEKREGAGMTQIELAQKSGLPQSHISRLENAQHSPSQRTLEKIARALGVGVSAFDPSTW